MRVSAAVFEKLFTFPYDRLIQQFPLDQVNEAMETSQHGDVIKPVLTMPH